MAYVPDEAIDRMDELSSGAWKLYCFLCRCRNHGSGKCNPSSVLTAKTIGVHTKNVFRLRRELAAKGWAAFEGDSATWMIYLSKNPIPEQNSNGSKNATTDDATEELIAESSKNATNENGNGSKNATGVAKMLLDGSKNMPNGSKNATATKEEPAKNQQIEPKKRERVVPIRANGSENGTAPKLSPLSLSLCEICKLNPDLLSPIRYSDLIATEKKLSANQRAPDDVREFARRWFASDWRGQRGEPPTLTLVLDEWERVMSGPVNGRGETWEEEKQRRYGHIFEQEERQRREAELSEYAAANPPAW